VQYVLDELLEEPDFDDDTYNISSNDSDGSISMLVCSTSSNTSMDSLMSGITVTSAYSLAASQLLSDGPQMASQAFMEFIDAVRALHNEVEISHVLDVRPKLSHAPQLHLLPEWGMHAPDRFC